MDLLSRKVQRGRRAIHLRPPRGFELLEFLMRHADQVVARTMLLENVIGLSFRSVDQRDRCSREQGCGRRSTPQRTRPLLRTVLRNAGCMIASFDG